MTSIQIWSWRKLLGIPPSSATDCERCMVPAPLRSSFGAVPAQHGLADEPFSMAAADAPSQERARQLRASAATAFHQVNTDRARCAAVLARTRAEHRNFVVGTYVFYYRQQDTDGRGGKFVPSGRWRGPALLCAVEEPAQSGPGSVVYWVAHGTALVRCAPEQLRHELPLERAERLATAPASEVSDSVFRRVARALRPVRGPVRFLDLTTGPSPAIAGETLDEPMDGPGDEPRDEPHLPPPASSSARTRARRDAGGPAAAAAATEVPSANVEGPATEVPSANVEAPATEVPSANVEAPATEVPSANVEAPATEVPSANTEAPATEVPVERAVAPVSSTARASEVEVSRERSRSPTRQRPDQMDEVTRRSLDRARAMDGLPPVRDPVRVMPSTWSTNFAENEDDVDDALIAQSELREKSFTNEQKAEFDEAKDNALRPLTENQAWTRAKASEAAEGQAVPMRFLLKYKRKDGNMVANARIILQGFKHVDVTEKKLDTESPTLSRIGKNLILFLCCQMKWKVWTADVKSEFLQADRIDTEVKIYAIPNADIRRRLSSQIGLRDDEIMKVLKPAFGDVRAPGQWYATADRVITQELGMVRHQLDRYMYLSLRPAQDGDDSYRVFNRQGAAYVLDGIFGIHVDDIICGGEKVWSKEDAMQAGVDEPSCFLERARCLLQGFKFGSVDFSPEQVFCGVQIKQSPGLNIISLSLDKYVHHIKPITIEKVRKQMVDEPLVGKEVAQLRSLLGALAWPPTQCIPMLSASVSLLQAAMSSPKIADLIEANKILRFAKEAVGRYEMKIHKHGNLKDLQLGAYTDAAWAVRPDGSSQGGFVIVAAAQDQVMSDRPFELTVIDWASRRLTRVCRSSLSAETQAAANAVDELEWARTVWHLMLWPFENPLNEFAVHGAGAFAITDAKSLYDASNSMSSGLKLSERRCAIELAMTNERLRAMGGGWRWCNSARQLADGLTKSAARSACLDSFARGVTCLQFDTTVMKAAKKVTHAERQAEVKELDDAAEKLNDNVYLAELGLPSDLPRCRLAGCQNPVINANQGHKYCSRRHYYKDFADPQMPQILYDDELFKRP